MKKNIVINNTRKNIVKIEIIVRKNDLLHKIKKYIKAGYKIVYNPHVELYHYESKSRGAEDDEKKVRRFQSEIEFMRSRWIGLLKAGDPCYNPNLTLASWNYGLRADGRGVKPWTK